MKKQSNKLLELRIEKRKADQQFFVALARRRLARQAIEDYLNEINPKTPQVEQLNLFKETTWKRPNI